jgi:hypothetical protein
MRPLLAITKLDLESLRAATLTYQVKFVEVAAFKDSGCGAKPRSNRTNGALPHNGPSGWGRAPLG